MIQTVMYFKRVYVQLLLDHTGVLRIRGNIGKIRVIN